VPGRGTLLVVPAVCPGMGTAARVVLSYPRDLSEWSRKQVDTDHFHAWLRRVHDHVEAGDTWTEFVDVGCCGSTYDVPLRVEAVEGGDRMGPETAIEYTLRDACDLESGWKVQSADGPPPTAGDGESPTDRSSFEGPQSGR